MRRSATWRLAALAVFVAVAAAVPACFKPDHPACAFTCIDPPHTCPAGYICGADNLCHDPNSPGFCDIDTSMDAGPDSGGQ